MTLLKSPLDDKIVTIKSRSYVEIRKFLGSGTYSVEKTNDCTLFYSVLLNSTNFPTHLWCLWRVVSFCVSGWETWAREMAELGGVGVVGWRGANSRQSVLDTRLGQLAPLISVIVTSGRHHLLLAQHLHSDGTAQLCHAKWRKKG